jgi:hypothetical protein
MLLAKVETYLALHVKCPKFVPDFNQIWMFWTDSHKSPQYQMSRKSFWGEPSWYLRTDGWTDVTKLTDAVRDYAKRLWYGDIPQQVRMFHLWNCYSDFHINWCRWSITKRHISCILVRIGALLTSRRSLRTVQTLVNVILFYRYDLQTERIHLRLMSVMLACLSFD